MSLFCRCLAVLCALDRQRPRSPRDFDCPRVTGDRPLSGGRAADVAARWWPIASELGLKKSFVIENRARRDRQYRDGSRWSMPSPTAARCWSMRAVIATFPSSFSKLGFDPVKDLAPVGGIGVTPTLLVAPKSLPADDLKGLVQLSRQRPDGLSFSTAGYGLLQHLAVEEMAQRTGAKFVHVVYKGGAQAATDLIAARVDFGSFAAGSVIQFVKKASSSPWPSSRRPARTCCPTCRPPPSRGCPASTPAFISCCTRRRRRPKEVVSILSGELNKIVGDPALKERFANIGLRPDARLAPDAAAAIMRKTGEVWAPADQAPEYQAGLTAAGSPRRSLRSADSCLYKPGISHADLGLNSRPVAHSDR